MRPSARSKQIITTFLESGNNNSITDGGDSITAEWEFGRGVTFPTKENCK